MKKISGVYKITNTITNDFYIGSSKDVKNRWVKHKSPSTWNEKNNPMYQDMQKYGVDKFDFQMLAQLEPEQLKEAEQEFIEKLQPTYNNRRAKGLDIEKYKKSQKKYQKKYHQTKEYKEDHKKRCKKYNNQLCSYNGKTLTFNALYQRFRRAGIENSALEAKKYLLDKDFVD